MSPYLLIPSLTGTALLGWITGMWTFKRSLNWCPADGATLICPECRKPPYTAGLASPKPSAPTHGRAGLKPLDNHINGGQRRDVRATQ